MNFKIINEELKIASCNVLDLPADVVKSFQWEPSASLRSLTLFACTSKKKFGEWYGWLVLNKDSAAFEGYLSIAESILSGGRIEDPAPESIKSTVEIIESLYDLRRRDALCFQAEVTDLTAAEGDVFLHLVNNRMAFDIFDMRTAFVCGIMQGKRTERAKKKRKASEPQDPLKNRVLEMLDYANERKLRGIYTFTKAILGDDLKYRKQPQS